MPGHFPILSEFVNFLSSDQSRGITSRYIAAAALCYNHSITQLRDSSSGNEISAARRGDDDRLYIISFDVNGSSNCTQMTRESQTYPTASHRMTNICQHCFNGYLKLNPSQPPACILLCCSYGSHIIFAKHKCSDI